MVCEFAILPDIFCMAKACACKPLTAELRASNRPMTSSPQSEHTSPHVGRADDPAARSSLDERGIVGDDFGYGDAPAQLFQSLAHRRAGNVGARTGMHGIADGQHRGIDHDASVPQAPVSNWK